VQNSDGMQKNACSVKDTACTNSRSNNTVTGAIETSSINTVIGNNIVTETNEIKYLKLLF
jgi:hypothetical protein